MLKTALVQFPNEYPGSTKVYDFTTDLDLARGDKVVCDTMFGYYVGDVVDIKRKSVVNDKWIVSKVDMEKQNIRIKNEKRLAEIRFKLRNKREMIEEIKLFEILAGSDPEFAELLEEYLELQKSALRN